MPPMSNRVKTIAKTIGYFFEQIIIAYFRISDQFSYPVQEFILKNDTLKDGPSSASLYGGALGVLSDMVVPKSACKQRTDWTFSRKNSCSFLPNRKHCSRLVGLPSEGELLLLY